MKANTHNKCTLEHNKRLDQIDDTDTYVYIEYDVDGDKIVMIDISEQIFFLYAFYILDKVNQYPAVRITSHSFTLLCVHTEFSYYNYIYTTDSYAYIVYQCHC